MTDKFVIEDINEALDSRAFPTITLWNRLEGRPRTADFTRALRAEARDALWMLSRQWQMGEFGADDAGSPVMAMIHTSAARLDKYRPNDHSVEKFENNIPLEAKVEGRAINFSSADRILSLDIRLLMGRQWLKMIGRIGDYKKEFIAKYPIKPPDPMRASRGLAKLRRRRRKTDGRRGPLFLSQRRSRAARLRRHRRRPRPRTRD